MGKPSHAGLETAKDKAENFLSLGARYRLGELETEKSHEKTRRLSEWAQNDPVHAIAVLKQIESEAVAVLSAKTAGLQELADEVQKVLAAGHRVFLCGCGATGRLCLTSEFLWRKLSRPQEADRVVAFMAGGDIALIRSIESFEDHTEFGSRQLHDLGFTADDLLIAVTEGGETSFVIGAAEEAAKVSKHKPFFLYCNPTEQLCTLVKRSRKILQNPAVRPLCLAFGPMSLSGSTRLQACTVQLLAVTAALFASGRGPGEFIENFRAFLRESDFTFLAPFVEAEAAEYRQQGDVLYTTDEFGMTILTDTTERSPTFSLAPFENFNDEGASSSLCYFHIQGTVTAAEAWHSLLLRPPRTLNWSRYRDIAGATRIPGYDFSDGVAAKRRQSTGRRQERFFIGEAGGKVVWNFKNCSSEFDWSGRHPAHQHLLLKVLLNIHSSLVMGRLHRYEGNWMTWVRPSNGKLIDRAIRYVLGLSEKQGRRLTYEQVAYRIFEEMETLGVDEPIVLKTLNSLTAESES